MAIPLKTYGSTLTDLQAGTNAAQGLDYSRANAQDATSMQRLEAFLRLQGQKYAVTAQQNALAADRAMRMAELAQQDKQFGTSEANRMALGQLAAKTQTDIAKETKGGLDPRAFETMLAYNQQGQEKEANAQALSVRRQSLMKEIAAYKDRHFYGNGTAAADFKAKYGREPDGPDAASKLSALDTQATSLGLIPNDITWGYDYKQFTPIVPGPLRGGTPVGGGSPLPSIQPSTPASVQAPAMFQGGGDVSLGGVPLNNFIDSAPAVDALAPSTVAPPVNRFKWTPQGAIAY